MKIKLLKAAHIVVFLFTLSSSAFAGQSTDLLNRIQEKYWQYQLDKSLYIRLTLGYPIEQLPDVSEEEATKEANFYRGLLDELKQVNLAELSTEEALSYEIMKWESAQSVELLPFHKLNFPVTPYASPIPLTLRAFSEFPFRRAEDQQKYLKLLSKYPAFLTKIREHLIKQKEQGIFIPKEEVPLVTGFLSSLSQEKEKSPFYVADVRLTSVYPANVVDEFQKEISRKIHAEINPAISLLLDVLSKDYEAKAPDRVGLSQYPGGSDYYKLLVRLHTTMNRTPEEIHETGLKTVASINAQMEKIRNDLNFKGTKADFHKFLKTDPKFIPKTANQIGETLMSYVKRIEPKIDSYFMRKPKAGYGVQRLDPKLEGSMTFGYYRQPTPSDPTGIYYYNGANLKERPLFNSASLVFHELVPGHHFQLSLQSENDQLPEFRKFAGHTAFIEGWAEYASGLAGEMGMYQDPYEEYGRLAAEMFLTVRLVVDTGMNHLGWPRAKAMEYMRENLLESETQIQTETLRYSCDIPGQALAYKMGSLKIVELREKTKKQLGDRFDIRKFHDVVLSSGSMPMSVLESHLERYVPSAGK